MIIPKKSLGQNFLKDKNIVNKIIKSINVKDKKIIEIGPGLGALTTGIIKLKPKKLILIEKDFFLHKDLLERLNSDDVTVINEDALLFDFTKFKDFKIISNLPYNISSKFLVKIIKLNKNINQIVCMIQSELADKFNYKFGKMNKYKFLFRYCGEFKILFNVSSNVFYPKPKVKSKVVLFNLTKKNINQKKLDQFIRIFFINKRKKIKSNKNFPKEVLSQKILNQRYEDLNYNDVLNIYERFNFFIR